MEYHRLSFRWRNRKAFWQDNPPVPEGLFHGCFLSLTRRRNLISSVCPGIIALSCVMVSLSSKIWISFALEAIVFSLNLIPLLYQKYSCPKRKQGLKNAEFIGKSTIFLCRIFTGIQIFLLCFECFGLIDIDSWHQPVKLSPGKIPDFWLLPGPLVSPWTDNRL